LKSEVAALTHQQGKPRGLTSTELENFKAHGYVIVKNVFTAADFAHFELDYTALIDGKARELLASGQIQNIHEDKPFSTRLGHIAGECSPHCFNEDLGPWGLQLDTMYVTSIARTVHSALLTVAAAYNRYARQRGCFELFFTKRLLACVEDIVGPEITLNPIQHCRPYLPTRASHAQQGVQTQSGAATLAPWHQDQGVTREEADASEILTCWFVVTAVVVVVVVVCHLVC
jgi:hypothetical protein